MSFFVEGAVKIDILKSRKGIGEPPNPPSGRRRLCAVRVLCRRQNLGAGGIHFCRAFESPKGGAALRAAKPKTKGHLQSRCPFLCHTPTIWIFQNFTQASRTAPHRPSGRRRECAVQAFSPQAKTLAQGEFISPEHFKSKGGGRLGRPKPQKKDMTHGHVFLLGRDG